MASAHSPRGWEVIVPYAVSLGLVLAILWILLSGYFQPLLIGFGIASVLLTVAIAHHLKVAQDDRHPIHLTSRILSYWAWLLWQIFKSNIDVARAVLAMAPVKPVLFRVRARQKSELARVVFANSITLTPGTVSLALGDDGWLEVHALTRAGALDLMDRRDGTPSEMNRRCADIEERQPRGRGKDAH